MVLENGSVFFMLFILLMYILFSILVFWKTTKLMREPDSPFPGH